MRSKIGRNDICPCGSRKKYKKCCLKIKQNSKLEFNKRFNRFESDLDHHYVPFNYYGYKYSNVKPYQGKIKCRLVHLEGNSIIIPDFIFLKNGWIQPLQFLAPSLVKFDEDNSYCQFFIDIQNGETIKVSISKKDYIKSYNDYSQLFNCEIFGPMDIEDYSCGDYKEIDNNIYLKLFHHTNPIGFKGISESRTILASKWNYKGNKECTNYNFAYFTHIPKIEFNSDLITVAMSSEGNIDYAIDSFNRPTILFDNFREAYQDEIYTAKVYRATTKDRNHPLTFYVPIESIDIKHIYQHTQDSVIFYEICFPYIHRIKMIPENKLIFNEDKIIQNNDAIVNSNYAIVGDATIISGLAAPFEEEETKMVFKIENCKEKSFLDFWFDNSNQDLFSKKVIKEGNFKEVKNNPTIKNNGQTIF